MTLKEMNKSRVEEGSIEAKPVDGDDSQAELKLKVNLPTSVKKALMIWNHLSKAGDLHSTPIRIKAKRRTTNRPKQTEVRSIVELGRFSSAVRRFSDGGFGDYLN